ncbi:MAG: orotate phosphoribosyltransferase [Acidiferrobacteraceae bacterium]|nr:orotate phosphoribosyltransferase [Acidiferrobacteraceae bacterium]
MKHQIESNWEHEFLEFAISSGALRFGEFNLKSGRLSPYFFNTGLFNNGALLSILSRFYAKMLNTVEQQPFMLFGPAYKGIPLVATVATALAEEYNRVVPFAFNRKEIKDHGEGGLIIGAKLTGRVVIVDDVVTAGTSATQAAELITAAGATPVALAIALDREEKGISDVTVTDEIRNRLDIDVHSIAKFSSLIKHLREIPLLSDNVPLLEAYHALYGASQS